MNEIEKFLEKYHKQGQTITLACSAWPDSMYLLYKILKSKYKKYLVVCYLNHKTRVETDKEESFLKDLCKKEKIKFETSSCDFEKIKKEFKGKSFEELAREKRYEFFNNICKKYKSNTLITAHHLDDKIETFYFNLNRWTKITGLINMSEFSCVNKKKWEVWWIWIILRPLINLEKKEILNYLDENKLKYFIDSTNLENKYSRNYLRNELIPKFEEINSNFKKNISNFQDYLSQAKDFIDNEIEIFFKKQSDLIKNSWKYKINKLKINWYFYTKDFNNKSNFFQKEIIRYIFYKRNNNSTIGLSQANIKEVIKFINWKNNKTIKQIKNMILKKENEIIIF